MRVTRHYLTVNGRRVHYRRCGEGPPLLMVHQSPRSSAEYSTLMQEWGAHFTCIAPDTPGFGQSDPLTGEPEIAEFADAICEVIEALRIGPVAAYGFHSGGIILVTAMRRRPELFRTLAVGGYAIWTAEEMAIFGDRYLPPFEPSAYGEHLHWLWQRMLEQSWFFPWFDTRNEAKLSVAHADVARVNAAVMEMLDAGDAYRAGYGAVLRAPRDIPPPDAITPPVLISAYAGDPLQAHIDRLGEMPAGWTAAKVATPADHQALSRDFLVSHAVGGAPALTEASDGGFVHAATPDFDGLIHWQGERGAPLLWPAAPGAEARLVPGVCTIDLPGHGLSDRWPGDVPSDFAAWAAVAEAARAALEAGAIVWPEAPVGDPLQMFPDLGPDRFGSYLTRAHAIARASVFFAPWYDAAATHMIDVDQGRLTPEALHLAARALLRATGARGWATALQNRV
jgi:haloalkane dehalogenase